MVRAELEGTSNGCLLLLVFDHDVTGVTTDHALARRLPERVRKTPIVGLIDERSTVSADLADRTPIPIGHALVLDGMWNFHECAQRHRYNVVVEDLLQTQLPPASSASGMPPLPVRRGIPRRIAASGGEMAS